MGNDPDLDVLDDYTEQVFEAIPQVTFRLHGPLRAGVNAHILTGEFKSYPADGLLVGTGAVGLGDLTAVGFGPTLGWDTRDSNFWPKAGSLVSLDLTVFADEAAYEARYTSAQRKRRKKIRKALEETFGPLRYEIVEDGPAGSAVIATILAEKSRWVDDRGRHNRILSCPVLRDFLDRLAARDEAGLIVSQLSAGAQPVSWDIGLRHNGIHFCFITAHVNALTDFSPARLHMDFSQRQALRDRVRRRLRRRHRAVVLDGLVAVASAEEAL